MFGDAVGAPCAGQRATTGITKNSALIAGTIDGRGDFRPKLNAMAVVVGYMKAIEQLAQHASFVCQGEGGVLIFLPDEYVDRVLSFGSDEREPEPAEDDRCV